MLVTGGTGFVGTYLVNHLRAEGHEVEVVSRRPNLGVDWSEASLKDALASTDAVAHLAGAGVLDARWSATRKREIEESRVETTRTLARLCAEVGGVRLVGASAVGYYGPRDATELDERAPPGEGFLADVCRAWEDALAPAREARISTASIRIGVVLARDGGALKRMLLPFKLGLGGPLGHGRQPFPWIHVADLTRLFALLLTRTDLTGPFNGTAPGGTDQRTFARTLGRVLARPAFLRAPGFVLRALLGEGASVLLTGQQPVPRRALEAGFEFEHPELEAALTDLVASPEAREPRRPRGGI